MAFFKKPKKNDSIHGQLGGLAKQIGIEVVGELKETGKEMLGMRKVERSSPAQSEKNWADEWLKNQDQNKPPISEKLGEHSPLNLQQEFGKQEDRELRQVQAKLNQMYTQASSESEYGKAKIQEKQQANQPVYDQVWKERQEKQQQQQTTKVASSPGLAATGSKRPAGDWRHGAKRKRQATPQELNRAEFRGSKGQ